MRSSKIIGLVAVATLAAMAFVGTSTASAGSTQLCQNHTSLTCSGGTAVVNLVNEGVGSILSGVFNVLCLTVRATILPLGLASPQSIHTLGIEMSGCGTTSAHNNCTVTIEELPLFNLLKTGLDQGTLEATSGQIKVACPNLSIDCKYDLAGILFSAGAQHFTAKETIIKELGEKITCPDEPKFDALLKTSTTSTEPSLCKKHSDICKTEDLVNKFTIKTTATPILLNSVDNIECTSSTGAITVLDLMVPSRPIELDVTELTWTGCKAKSSGSSCTMATEKPPTFDLKRTALNLGEVTTLGFRVGLECAALELECVFEGEAVLTFEGALHQVGTGHGKLIASEDVLKKVEGGENCPETVKWDATYELSEHAYLGPALTGNNTYILS